MQPLPILAPGPADQLGCWRHRGPPPPIHAWLRPTSFTKPQREGTPQPPLPLTEAVDLVTSTVLHPIEMNLCLDPLFLLVYFMLPMCSPLHDPKLTQFPSFWLCSALLTLPGAPLSHTPIFGLLFLTLFLSASSITSPLKHLVLFIKPAQTFILLFTRSHAVNDTCHWRNSYVASQQEQTGFHGGCVCDLCCHEKDCESVLVL